MQALVRTPDQHEPVTTRSPLLKPSNRTCLPVAGLQEHATAPGTDSLCSQVSGSDSDSVVLSRCNGAGPAQETPTKRFSQT